MKQLFFQIKRILGDIDESDIETDVLSSASVCAISYGQPVHYTFQNSSTEGVTESTPANSNERKIGRVGSCLPIEDIEYDAVTRNEYKKKKLKTKNKNAAQAVIAAAYYLSRIIYFLSEHVSDKKLYIFQFKIFSVDQSATFCYFYH